jgi:hypothetical protein
MKDGRLAGCTAIDDELQNQMIPIMHECYQLGIINHTIPCPPFYGSASSSGWIITACSSSSQQEIEQEEKKKLAAIIAEKETWEKNGTIPPRK